MTTLEIEKKTWNCKFYDYHILATSNCLHNVISLLLLVVSYGGEKNKTILFTFFGSEVTNSLGPYLLGGETVISVMYELVEACLLSKQAWTGLNKYRHDHSFFLLFLFSFVLKHFSLLVRFMSKTSEFPIDVLDIHFILGMPKQFEHGSDQFRLTVANGN